jgi:hypothetical protein
VNQPVQDAPDQVCPRRAAVGTHYLTCPTLRLPPGYRFSEDPGREVSPATGSEPV